MRENPLLSRANELGIYNFDSAGNGVYLPNNPDAAAVARADPNWTDPTPVHTSGHPQYSARVAQITQDAMDEFESDHGPIAGMSNEKLESLAPEINALIEEIQQDAGELLSDSDFVIDGVLQ